MAGGSKTRFTFNSKLLEKRMMKRLVKIQTERFVNYAKEEIVRLATSHSFDNRTFNLQDSYVWCVYYNGKRVPNGFGYYGSKLARKPSFLHEYSPKKRIEVNGRELARTFAQSYQPSTQDGWEIVFAACAPYGAYLELGRKFLVMSQRYDHIRKVLEPYCSVTFEINPPKY